MYVPKAAEVIQLSKSAEFPIRINVNDCGDSRMQDTPNKLCLANTPTIMMHIIRLIN